MHQLTTISKLILVALAGFAHSFGNDADDLYRRYKATIFSSDVREGCDRTWVTPAMQQTLLQKARSEYASSDPKIKEQAYQALIELGDASALKTYIQSGGAKDRLSDSLLPYLIEDVEHGDTTYPPIGISVRDKATREMYLILGFYPSFPPQTREWADKWQAKVFGPSSEANQLMRAWWQHNKEAVLAHRYGDATWLPTPEQEKALTESLKAQNTEPDLSLPTPETPVQ